MNQTAVDNIPCFNASETLDWTVLREADAVFMHGGGDGASSANYVDLLKNPEANTKYGGPSAWRVWHAIQQENCFGGLSDQCVEKRTFYRVMSGLQASISTHISISYAKRGETWYSNSSVFNNAVRSYPERLDNMYFTFLFLLRAIIKGEPCLLKSFRAAKNSTEEQILATSLRSIIRDTGMDSASNNSYHECRNGFDETVLFQADSSAGEEYWDAMHQKVTLVDEFRSRFRNISKILNCVTCEKCRLWGKLQVLGVGTAIKLLLTPPDVMEELCGASTPLSANLLDPHEVSALINTLHQITKSVHYSNTYTEGIDLSHESVAAGLATDLDSTDVGEEAPVSPVLPIALSGLCVFVTLFVYTMRQRR